MNLSFEEWESLHEGQFFDKIKNFLSRSVGGDVSKLDELLAAYRTDKAFKSKVDESAKKILRMKLALGLLKAN